MNESLDCPKILREHIGKFTNYNDNNNSNNDDTFFEINVPNSSRLVIANYFDTVLSTSRMK